MSNALEKTKKKEMIVYKTRDKHIREAALCALLCALMCVSAMISIPLPIPATLQTLVLFFGLFFVGGRLTAIATLLYILLGALGVPVFSGFSGGASRLFDATGGFIFGLLAAALLYWLLEFILPSGKPFKLIGAVLSQLTIYIFGMLWYWLVYLGGGGSGLLWAFVTSVVPFILPDAIKLLAAYIISKRISRLVSRKSTSSY